MSWDCAPGPNRTYEMKTAGGRTVAKHASKASCEEHWKRAHGNQTAPTEDVGPTADDDGAPDNSP